MFIRKLWWNGERVGINKELLGNNIFRALLLHSASMKLAQGWLKMFNHFHFFFVLLSWDTDTGPPLHSLPGLAAKTVWCLVLLLTLTLRVKNLHHYIFFDAYTLFLSVSHQCNSHDIATVFSLPWDTGEYPILKSSK